MLQIIKNLLKPIVLRCCRLEELQWSRVTLMVELKDYKQALIVLEEIRQSRKRDS